MSLDVLTSMGDMICLANDPLLRYKPISGYKNWQIIVEVAAKKPITVTIDFDLATGKADELLRLLWQVQLSISAPQGPVGRKGMKVIRWEDWAPAPSLVE